MGKTGKPLGSWTHGEKIGRERIQRAGETHGKNTSDPGEAPQVKQARNGEGSECFVFQSLVEQRQSPGHRLGVLGAEAAEGGGKAVTGSLLEFGKMGLEMIGGGDIDDPAIGVRPNPLDQIHFLQSVHYAGDGAVGAAGGLCQGADGHGAVGLQNGQHDGLGIGQVQLTIVNPKLFGDMAADL